MKSNWSLVPGPICFWQLCPLKGTGFKRKNKVNFFKHNTAGLFEGIFFWGEGQFDPPFVFHEELI